MMDRENSEHIGRNIGEFLEVDVDADGCAIGEYLRIKVKLDVRKPLIRQIKILVNENDGAGTDPEEESEEWEEEGKDGNRRKFRWCLFAYEDLPNFCFTCGLIGHVDKECAFLLKTGEKPLYSK
jgi:hypothetical protein